jgi:Predicted periplasmic lipoprotein (DUF2279)
MLRAQDVEPERDFDSSNISTSRLVAVCALTEAGLAGGYAFQNNLWWKGEESPFHFDWEHDWTYALGSDKLGHFYFPYAVTKLYGQAFAWCGVDTASSLWLAGGLGLAHQTFVEVRDGFSAEWGFSWGDFVANTLGAGYPIAQHYIEPLGSFDWKISFQPSAKYKAGAYRAIIDDYESAYHWLSVDVHDLLPAEARDFWPAWLNIAAGHSVKDLDLRGGGYHEIFLSLDWNLEGLPGDGWFWNLLKKNLNLYHLPAPAVRIYPGVVWYGLKF